MATAGDIANKARALTHTDIAGYTTANILIDFNEWYQKVVSMVNESQDSDTFDDQRSTTYPVYPISLVAGQRDYQIPVSVGALKIKRIDVTYDGSSYFRARPFDGSAVEWGFGNTTNEDSNFIKQAPAYQAKYNSLFIYPLAVASDVSAGAQFIAEVERNIVPFTSSDYTVDLSDSTVVPGFDPVFHMMIAWGMAMDYAVAQNLPQQKTLAEAMVDWEARLRQAYGRKNLDTVLSLRPAYDNFGDYGATGTGGYFYGR